MPDRVNEGIGRSVPLIVQGDGALLLATAAPGARSVADGLRRFAELEKCPGAYHHYRLTRQSLWNAAASGVTAARIIDFLRRASAAPLPPSVERGIAELIDRWGRLWLECGADGGLWLRSDDPALLERLVARLGPGPSHRPGHRLDGGVAPGKCGLPVLPGERGLVKARLARLGWPVRDTVPYDAGGPLDIAWRPGLSLRPYQREALAAVADERAGRGGSGLVLLPCGAGKTLVGVGATVALGCHTLVLCPNSTSVRQWVAAYAGFTTLAAGSIGEYGPRRREVRPVTVTTYQMLTARAPHPHLGLMMEHAWGLIIFDEVHLLPADAFRLTAEVQSRRRLGLTATPVREDGRETELCALVGPVLYTAPWDRLEAEGWIAPVECVEVRVPAEWGEPQAVGATLSGRQAASVVSKWPVVRAILRRHRGEGALVIGHYLDQLCDLATRLRAPLVTGATPASERERLFDRFREGAEPVLVLSRVGNAALDLPGAAVAIEVSGNFGSRQEEAQRLGRVLRPKGGRTAHFYALVTEDSVERDHAGRRQRFLVEQGYHYRIVTARELLMGPPGTGAP